ncbi:MAG TPA: DMT family transporter [Rhodothermales bacterium]
MKSRLWLLYAIVTTTFWGVWGAFIEIPERAGFPATLGYSVWALTMIPPALVALRLVGWRLDRDRKAIVLGSLAGLLGAGGQLVLFQALTVGPAYIVFPLISLSPLVTILMSVVLLREKASARGWIGIVLAVGAVPLLSYQPPDNGVVEGYLWLVLALGVFLAWGIQAYVIKFANRTMSAESVFFYMMATAVVLIPWAIGITDFSQEINWGWSGPGLAAGIQILNSIGALCLVFAFRYGKAIIVSPMTNALAPVLTVLISLSIYAVIPGTVTIVGMVLAIAAAFLMALEEETESAIPVPAVGETPLSGAGDDREVLHAHS